MRIHLIAVGRLKAGPEQTLAARYLDRFAKAGPSTGLELGRVVELAEGRSGSAETRRREEASALAKAVPEGAIVILLDETGRTLGSQALAAYLGERRDEGRRDACLVIGGPDGHGDDLKSRADLVLSFGRMTWPHQLVRIMAAEQLYRSVTILAGHPYHRA